MKIRCWEGEQEEKGCLHAVRHLNLLILCVTKLIKFYLHLFSTTFLNQYSGGLPSGEACDTHFEVRER